MKAHTQHLTLHLPDRVGFVNITPEVQRCVTASGVREGLVLVNAMHITASVFINDDEPGLHHDYCRWLEELAITGALCGDPAMIYHAIAHDPLTAAVLSLAEIKTMVNEMFQQNKSYLPHFKSFSV